MLFLPRNFFDETPKDRPRVWRAKQGLFLGIVCAIGSPIALFIAWSSLSQGFNVRIWVLAIAVSLGAPVFLLGAVLEWRNARKYERIIARKRSGLCLNCGYDLRENPQTCPECGFTDPTTVETKATPDWQPGKQPDLFRTLYAQKRQRESET